MSLFTPSLKGRVMQVIKTRIVNAQKKFEEELNTLETDYEEEVKTLELSHEKNKEDLFETHANTILKGFNL